MRMCGRMYTVYEVKVVIAVHVGAHTHHVSVMLHVLVSVCISYSVVY